MRLLFLFLYFCLHFPVSARAEASVSPVLFFLRNPESLHAGKSAGSANSDNANVTVRFSRPPDSQRIRQLETQGLLFKRDNDRLVHSKNIYLATVELDNLETLARNDDIIAIESSFNPSCASTLNVSNPQVQASRVWNLYRETDIIDGTGIIVTSVDTGIDIFHPGFFKPDGGLYEWLDVNKSGEFENGFDAVDLNKNGKSDLGETLGFFDAGFSDPLGLIKRTDGEYEADIDWLYNDNNHNGTRDFGPDAGYTERDFSYGELLFIISDSNGNNRLDPDEKLTALGTSRIIATFDKAGKHYRGIDLFESLGDEKNHGTPSFGVAGGQFPSRRLAGMAPGVEFISIDRLGGTFVEEGILWARDLGTHMIMYEFGSWVYNSLDGTSSLEVLINNLYGEGIFQFTAAGNLAGPKRKKHAFLTLQKGEQDNLYFSVPDLSIKEVYISILWRDRFFDPAITLLIPESQSLIISGKQEQVRIGNYLVSSYKITSPKLTNRVDILIESNDPIHDNMSLSINNRSLSPLEIDAYISDDVTMWMHGAQFQNHLTDDGTVCSPGTAEKGITVGAYDPRGKRNPIGSLNDFSSWGETIDGRRAVDITAPGSHVYSLASHDKMGGQPGGYVAFDGTSASLPHVVGCAALILQISPGITPDDLSSILFNGALADEFTGDVPNDKWGYGKLRVYDSISNSDIVVNVHEDSKPAVFSVSSCYPNPFNSKTSFDISIVNNRKANLYISVYNILGQKARSFSHSVESPGAVTITWDGKSDSGISVSTGIYLFTFSYDNNILIRKALYIK